MIELSLEQPADSAGIEALLDTAFGTGRFAKSSYSYRYGVTPLRPLCLTAHAAGAVVGTIRAWPVQVGQDAALAILIGPVAVASACRGAGLGAALVRQCLDAARGIGGSVALLVGDEPYYGRFGFRPAATLGIAMARENPARVLGLPLAARTPRGIVLPWRSVRGLSAAA